MMLESEKCPERCFQKVHTSHTKQSRTQRNTASLSVQTNLPYRSKLTLEPPLTFHASGAFTPTSSGSTSAFLRSFVSAPSTPAFPSIQERKSHDSCSPRSLPLPIDRLPQSSPSSFASCSPSIPLISRTSSSFYASEFHIHHPPPPSSSVQALLTPVPHPKNTNATPFIPVTPSIPSYLLVYQKLHPRIRRCATCNGLGRNLSRCTRCGVAWCSRKCRTNGNHSFCETGRTYSSIHGNVNVLQSWSTL